MQKSVKLLIFVLMGSLLLAGAKPAGAVCIYNQEDNAVWIYDYTADLPAGPRQLMFAEQLNQWGLVSYDRSNDTCTVKANLWIGRDNGTDTYFQLGGPGHPRATLILQGDLVIYPSGNQSINRLTVGCPDNPEIHARVLFDNGPGKPCTLRAGAYYRGNRMTPGRITGGELLVYHGTITSADPGRPIGSHLYLYLDRIVLNSAAIAGVNGTIGYGVNAGNSLIEDCVFSDSRMAFGWGSQAMRGTTFRGLKTVFGDSSRYPLNAALTECRFEENDANWDLQAGNIYLVDCEVGPPRRGNRYAARTNAVFTVHHARVGAQRTTVHAGDVPESIRAVSSRHVMLKVVDLHGKPLGNARVEARCEQDDRIVRTAMTGAGGMTPGRGEPGALLLDEWEETAGESANQPVRREFSYRLTVTPRKKTPVCISEKYFPTQSWQIVETTLK